MYLRHFGGEGGPCQKHDGKEFVLGLVSEG